MKVLHAFLAGQQLAIGRKNRRDSDQILGSDPGVAQRQFKRCQPLAVFPHSLGKENPLRNHVFAQFVDPPQTEVECENAQSNTTVCKGNMNFRVEQKKRRQDLLQAKAERKRPQSWTSLIVLCLRSEGPSLRSVQGVYLAA